MSQQIQRRYLPRTARRPELREQSDGAPPMIVGYAAVFYREGDPGTEYEMWPAGSGWPRVVERIMPGAFDRAVKEDDVRGLFNHDPANILGRKSAGTLRLSVDDIGLRYEIDPPDTQTARDLLVSLKRGDVSGSSFAFIPTKTEYRDLIDNATGKGETIVERLQVELLDVGPVTFPAYTGATSGARSGEPDEASRAEVEAIRAERNRGRDSVLIDLALMEMEAAASE